MRDNNSLNRLLDGAFVIYQDPQFLANNEDPLNWRGPTVIKPLSGDSDSLCPNKALSVYLKLTEKAKSSHIFVHPVHLGKWNISAMRLSVVRLIKASQLHSLPRAHNIRKMATSLAFYSNMSIIKLVGNPVIYSGATTFTGLKSCATPDPPSNSSSLTSAPRSLHFMASSFILSPVTWLVIFMFPCFMLELLQVKFYWVTKLTIEQL